MRDTDNRAFTEMYTAHYASVLCYVQRRTHPSRVDDIVAETFTVAWRRRARLPPAPRPWLFRTAANILKSLARGEARQRHLAIRSWEPPLQPINTDANVDLINAWRQLTRADREVIALHAWEELADSEAAEVLQCTRAAYSMRLTRAKRRLAALLAEPATDRHAQSHLRSTEGTP